MSPRSIEKGAIPARIFPSFEYQRPKTYQLEPEETGNQHPHLVFDFDTIATLEVSGVPPPNH